MTQAADDASRTNLDNATARAESELARALEAYFVALEEGCPIDGESLAADHPAVADRIRDCIKILDAADSTQKNTDEAPAGARLGDFVLLKLIGRGGMGIVFKAEQLSLRRRVAVKILPSAAALDPLRLHRFQVEAQAAARLHHTNIVPVFSVGCEQGVHYYAMQYIDGMTLADWLREARGGRRNPRAMSRESIAGDLPVTDPATSEVAAPSPNSAAPEETSTISRAIVRGPGHHRRVAEWGVQAADALEHAHRHGVIHRDVKPSNMMVDGDGTLWITDFGLARLTGDPSLTLAGDLLGTLRYMSPEQSLGGSKDLDGRTDVYSLGATLYELLTLHPARDGADRDALLAAIANGEPRRLRSWDRSLPRDLQTIVLHSLARDREARYQSAGEMAADLRRFLDGRPILARRPSLLKRTERWARRHKSLVASLLFTVALAALGGSALLILLARNRDLARTQRRGEYCINLLHSSGYIDRNDLADARALLSRHIPAPGQEDNRDFAWHHLWRLCNIRPQLLVGHEKDVYHVEYSPDGRTLASCGQDGTIRLWDAETNAHLRTYRGHDGDINWVAFSPDGKRLASCGNDGTVRLWDAADVSIPPQIVARTDREVVAVLFTPDGRSLIWGGDAGSVVSYDLETGSCKPLASTNGRRIGCMALSPDGRLLGVAFGDKPGCLLLDLVEGGPPKYDAGASFLNCIAMSDDGRKVATANNHGEVRMGAPGYGFVPFSSDPENNLEGIAFSRDSRILATCGHPGYIRLRDAETNEVMNTFYSDVQRHWGLAFSPRGDRLAACGVNGSVEVWGRHIAQDKLARKAEIAPTSPFIPAWSSRFMTVATLECDDVRFQTWDFDSGKVVWTTSIYAPGLTAVAISPDQTKALLFFDDSLTPLRLASLDAPPGTPLQVFEAPDVPAGYPHRFRSATFSPDGKLLAVFYNVFKTQNVGLWNVDDGRRATAGVYPKACEPLCPPVFSPDGRRLAIVRPGDIRLLDVAGPDFVHFTPTDLGWTNVAAWSPDGRKFAVGYSSGSVALFDPGEPDAEPVLLEAAPHLDSLAFSPDGRLLACAPHNGSTILLDLATGRRVLTFKEVPPLRWGNIQVKFSPDGSTLSRLTFGDARPPLLINWLSGVSTVSPRP